MGKRTWTGTSQRKTYKWPINTKKVPYIIILEGNANYNHNKIYYILSQMDEIKALDNSWQECGATRMMIFWRWLWMSTTSLEKIGQFFIKSNTFLPYDPVMLLLWIYSTEIIISMKRYAQEYSYQLSSSSLTWNPFKCPSTVEWIDKSWYIHTIKYYLTILKRTNISPGWCGSVDWVLACEPKGHQFNSQSEHMPGLQARSPVGGMWAATRHWYFSPSLSPSLSLSLKINK